MGMGHMGILTAMPGPCRIPCSGRSTLARNRRWSGFGRALQDRNGGEAFGPNVPSGCGGDHMRGRVPMSERLAAPVAVPLGRYEDALLTVEANVEGTVSTFLFDTGAGVTLLSWQEAKRHRLTPFGRLTGHRMTGERVDMQRCDGVRLEIGGYPFCHDTVGILDLDALLPPDVPRPAGAVALNTFASQPITIDLADDTLFMETGESLSQRVANMKRLEMRIARPLHGIGLDVFVGLEAGSALFWLELDTANAGPAVVAPHLAEIMGWRRSGGEGVFRRELRLAGYGEVSTDVVVKDIIYDGNLGTSFLQGRCVSIDLRRARLWLD